MTVSEPIFEILFLIYVIASYLLVIYAISHDAKINGVVFFKEMSNNPSSFLVLMLAPIISLIVLMQMSTVIYYRCRKINREERRDD